MLVNRMLCPVGRVRVNEWEIDAVHNGGSDRHVPYAGREFAGRKAGSVRADVQGLRAIAIISVLAYHAGLMLLWAVI